MSELGFSSVPIGFYSENKFCIFSRILLLWGLTQPTALKSIVQANYYFTVLIPFSGVFPESPDAGTSHVAES
ncbi:MAG: hypothetical protein GXO82_02500 [Chlorobi bacterium]|nr:hypothetical protein [Chlorobiota bacterium]